MGEFTHFDSSGSAVMVDVSDKEITERTAVAKGRIRVSEEVFRKIREGTMKKGDVLGIARTAGIMAAKRTFELIPLCHLLALTRCTIDFAYLEETLEIEACCTVKTVGKTGVEIEALTGVEIALLTIYDMCKALDRSMEMNGIRLCYKNGGKSGEYRAAGDGPERQKDPESIPDGYAGGGDE